MVLDREVLLAAEAAAHELAHHLHPLPGHPQDPDDAVQVVIDALGAGVDGQGAVGPGHRQGALRLEEGVLGGRGSEGVAGDVGRLGQGGVGVAPGEHRPGQQVALRVQARRILGQGRLGRGQGREHLVLQLDHGQGRPGLGPGPGRHQRQRVAHGAGLLAHRDQGRPVVHDVALETFAGHVGGGHHPHHPRRGLGPGGIDGQDPRPRLGRPQHGPVQHARDHHVVHVFAGAQHLGPGIQARHPVAHAVGAGLGLGQRQFLPQQPGRAQDRLFNLGVAGAAADVAMERLLDLGRGRIRLGVQQALGADHHPRDAEAALDRPGVGESPGIDLLLALGEALHREHRPPVQLGGGEQAGPAGLAIHQDHAGAAGALGTAVLHRGQPEFIPEEREKVHILIGGIELAVDR